MTTTSGGNVGVGFGEASYGDPSSTDLFAVNLETGQEIYSRPFPLTDDSNFVTSTSDIYVINDKAMVYGIDAANGEQLWPPYQADHQNNDDSGQITADDTYVGLPDTIINARTGVPVRMIDGESLIAINNGRALLAASGSSDTEVVRDIATWQILATGHFHSYKGDIRPIDKALLDALGVNSPDCVGATIQVGFFGGSCGPGSGDSIQSGADLFTRIDHGSVVLSSTATGPPLTHAPLPASFVGEKLVLATSRFVVVENDEGLNATWIGFAIK